MEEQKTKFIEIFDDAFVYGEKNERLTGVHEFPADEADSLVENGYGKYVDAPEESGSTEGDEVPDNEWTVPEIKEWLDDEEVEYDEKLKKDELLSLVNVYLHVELHHIKEQLTEKEIEFDEEESKGSLFSKLEATIE